MKNKKKILIINGANLNLLGKREISIYGEKDFDSFLKELKKEFSQCEIEYYQSNIEGEIVNALQNFRGDGIIINAGGYTHTSVVIRDAICSIPIKCIEVHISNISTRESFRHDSLLSPVCNGSIIGFGLLGYKLGILSVINDES